MRKHFICDLEKQKKMPYSSWQCISLKLDTRDVDLVIKNERNQNKLVKYLLYKMKSIDGRVNSASKIISMMDQSDIALYQRKIKDLPKSLLTKIRLKNRLKVLK